MGVHQEYDGPDSRQGKWDLETGHPRSCATLTVVMVYCRVRRSGFVNGGRTDQLDTVTLLFHAP